MKSASIILLLITCLFSFHLFAQSDDCSGATNLTVNATCTYTSFSNNENGQPETGTPNPSCLSGTESSDAWYKFTGDGTTLQLSVTNLNFNATVAVWTDCPATVQVGCMNVTTAATGTLNISTTSGTTYYVQIIRTSGNTNDNQSGDICVSQGINVMTNGSVTTCSGSFYDPGGTSDYGNSQDFTYTICPGTAGMSVQAIFSSFSTENCCDYLTIYDGSSTAAPSLGTFQGTNSPGTVVGTSANGCLTFVFHSDGSVVSTGWIAALSCVPTPPPSTNVVMYSGSTTACSGTFLDPGGLGNYANSISGMVFTICPATAGNKLRAVFSSFQTENSLDFLEIFDGNSTAAPSLGTYTGTTSPGTVQATPSNASGCLTFRFTSDGSSTYAGWIATLSCIAPCQSITSNWVSSTEAPMGDGIIRICQNQSVNFVGSGTFSNSSAGATYTWQFGDGSTGTGTNVNHTYTTPGSYFVNLQITDPAGCTNTNAFNRNVQVSTNPTIGTTAAPATLCAGQSSTLNANVTMTPFTQVCTPPVSGTTFLPDGSGVSYQTAINVNCYSAAATVTAATDINNVCLTMEHSYLGDLQIELICPNGQTMILKSYANGGSNTYLGSPIDDVTSGPGTGSTYCFTPSASTLMVNGSTVSAGSPAGNSIAAGNYMPTQPFTNMIGCPLNGAWTIRVTDNLSADDGYIFNWDVNFNNAILSAPSFTPTIVSQGWQAATGLTTTGSTTATVVPTATGTPCYTYAVTDNFGCTYTQPQCLTVSCTVLPVGLISFDATPVNMDYVHTTWTTSGEYNNEYFKIQRSVDGQNWETLGIVPGQGSSDGINVYEFNDFMPVMGVSYYRLIQVDFNGSEIVYDPRAVTLKRNGSTELVAYPNPTNQFITVDGMFTSLDELRVMTVVGKVVNASCKIGFKHDGTILIDMANLSAGVYIIKYGEQSVTITKQ